MITETSACCFAVLLGAAACRQPNAVALDDRPPGSARPAETTFEALDVPVINAARGELYRGESRPQVVWTGSEAAFLYTSADQETERLGIGRLGSDGKELDRRPVAFETERHAAPSPDREVNGSIYPRWVGGQVASIYNTKLADRWIKVSPNGAVRAVRAVELDEEGRRVLATDGAMNAAGGFAVQSRLRDLESGEQNPQRLELYGATAQHVASVSLDCDTVDNITATDWGYALSCEAPFSPTAPPDAPTSAVLGIRDGKVAWTVSGLAAARFRSLGTDGERVLIVESGLNYPMTTMTRMLDRDGLAEGAAFTAQPHLMQEAQLMIRTREPMIWTGKEFATFVGRLLIRYASDGRPLGEWEVEPRCNREFEITGLAWTGAAYLVVGDWDWRKCTDRRLKHSGEPMTDDDRLYPLAPGLTWDPATDAIQSPGRGHG